jgi:hypothetical protein
LVVPVPGGTARISGLGIIEGREDTCSVFKVVSLKAGKAVSVLIRSGTLIRDRHTLLIVIEDPVFRASKTHLIAPVPSGTARISGLGIIER